MLVVGIVAFLSGVLLVAAEMLVSRNRHREKQEALERDRRDLAARLATLESSYPQALVMMDSRGLIRRVNSAAERLFGYDEADLLGHSILRLLPFAPSALNPLMNWSPIRSSVPRPVQRKSLALMSGGSTVSPIRIASAT